MLNKHLSEGLFQKTYLALCQGSAEFGPPLGRIRHGFRRVNKQHVSGKPSLLREYDASLISSDEAGGEWQLAELVIRSVRRVILRDSADVRWECEIQLITGRTHQIRLQLAALGYPIVFDTRYTPVAGLLDDGMSTGDELFGPEPKSAIGLHCASLDIPSPGFESPLDQRMKFKAMAPWWKSQESVNRMGCTGSE